MNNRLVPTDSFNDCAHGEPLVNPVLNPAVNPAPRASLARDSQGAKGADVGLAIAPPKPTISSQKIQDALRADGSHLGICPTFKHIRPKFDVHVFDSLPSTSTQVWQMLAEGAGAGTVAIAQQQSAGRGQRGRVWQSEPGGLYLSLALEPDWPASQVEQLTCISAWGIATALNNLGLPITVKWPNDLFFEGKKLGGILTETKLAQVAPDLQPVSSARTVAKAGSGSSFRDTAHIKQAVIGIGINWHNAVPANAISLATILEQRASSAAHNKINCLEVLAALVLKGILQGYFFRQQVGSQVFMKAYSNLLTPANELGSLEDGIVT
jgi:BirA family transcriptional regulator, biotin operon repressor / biotin---[acetyl-CoA-carboxylase] ligase